MTFNEETINETNQEEVINEEETVVEEGTGEFSEEKETILDPTMSQYTTAISKLKPLG